MDNQNYRLVAIKRDRIPEWLYRTIVRSALRPLAVRFPLRQLLHRNLLTDEEP